MKNTWMWIIVAIIIIGGGLWWWQSSGTAPLSDDGTSLAQDAIDDAQGSPESAAMSTVSATPAPGSDANAVSEMQVTNAPMSAAVTYDGRSFSPQTVTVKQGGTVTFTDASGTMWVASNLHPSHTGYDSTSRSEHCASGYAGPAPFDQCGTGSSYSFTFTEAGTWPYHDHVNASAGGTVVVVQ